MCKKVLFVLGDGVYPYHTGGMEVFNYYLIRELRRYFDLRYLATKKLDYDDCKFYSMLSLKPSKIVFPLQVFLHLLRHPAERTVLVSISSAHWFIRWMFAIMNRLLALNSVAVIHYGKSVPNKHKNVYGKFFRSQKYVVAVSEDIKRNYDKVFGTNCIVLPPIVPFAASRMTKSQCRDKYRIPQDVNVICMVGSIKAMKNPDTLIDAMSLMSREEKSICNPFALFAGDGIMRAELESRVASLGLSDRVLFLGNIPKEDIRDVMMASDIYLIASDFEGTSVSLLEAMFNKKAIIISRAPGLVDMCRERIDALAYETRNSEQLKKCIYDIITKPEDSQRRAKAANVHYKETYSYANMLNKYIEILS